MNKQYHSPLEKRLKAWHNEDWHTSKGRIIRDIVYAVDTGLVTTVSFIAGVSVSLLTHSKILVAGLIQITAGSIAIFFGSYISTKAQKHFFENQIEYEKKEIELDPNKETQEIREIFSEMNFNEAEQEIAVKRITADKNLWLKFMIQEEIGISPGFIDNPYEIGIISAVSYIIGAIPAIIPFFIFKDVKTDLVISATAVLIFLFILGIYKARITKVKLLVSGLETLLIGAVSCGAGFFLGRIVAGYFH